MKTNKFNFGILTAFTLTISSLLAFINLSEWFGIYVLEETEGYPFGKEGPAPSYYQTPEMYANVVLISGVLFVGTFIYGAWVLKNKQYADVWKPLVLTVLLLITMLFME